MKSTAIILLICLALLTGCRTIQYAPKYESIVATSTNTPTPTKTSVTPTLKPITPKPGFESEAIKYPEIWDLYLHHGKLDPIFSQFLLVYKRDGVDAAIKFAEPYRLTKDRSAYIWLIADSADNMPAIKNQLEKLGITVKLSSRQYADILVPMDNGDLVKVFAKLVEIPHIKSLERQPRLVEHDNNATVLPLGTISQTPTATPCPTITYDGRCILVCNPRHGNPRHECITECYTYTKQVCPTP
jgi:hypothetical protein